MDEHLVSGRGKGWEIWPGLKSSRKKKKKIEWKGRWVQMTERAAEIARKHAEGKEEDDYLFINPFTGSYYKPDALYRAFKNHGGVDGTAPHEAWRHTGITNVMETGIDVEDAALLTGQGAETLRNYDHPRQERQRNVMRNVLSRKVVSIRRRARSRSEIEVKNKGGSR